MAFFDKLKNLFSAPGNDAAEQPEETNEPAEQASSLEPEQAASPDHATVQEPNVAPVIGSEAYLLHDLKKNSLTHPKDMAQAEIMVHSALKKIQDRIELADLYELCCQNQENTDEANGGKPVTVESVSAKAEVFCSSDKMTGFIYFLAPVGDGADITEDMVSQAILASGIKYGIDQDKLAELVQDKFYYRIFAIARGLPAVHGKDGKIIDHFSREHQLNLQEDEHGKIDYKNLGLFQNVQKGQVICDLVQPEESKNGFDITGKTLPAKLGKMPPVPKGKNTDISEDGNALIATEDGDITFQNGSFKVEPKLVIAKNVDITTGNIKFAGDVVINGEVFRGFCVTAGGNLTVQGLVEGATLVAGGDILLVKGMNGNGGGSLTAGGSVISRFLEQTKIQVAENVSSDVIINCNIHAGGSILASSGKGIIIGGKLKAGLCVEAKRIGNQSEAHTAISIGVSTQKKENINDVTKELKEARDTLSKITKNYNYLSSLPSLPDSKKALFETLGEQKKLYSDNVAKLQEELYALQNKDIDYSQCHVRGDIIYGVTEVELHNSRVYIRDTSSKCSIYYSKEKGDLVIGTF